MAEYQKKRYVAQGSVEIGGERVSYTATSEDFPICGEDGGVEASVFTYSYEREGVEAAGRPVLFGWNGGPGSASIYVHMGMLAPQRADCPENPQDFQQTAPFSMINNDHCLLDVCDIVVMDAIGTGYSRILDPEKRKDYQSSDADAWATVILMRRWLTAHQRWNSPIYIMGESYGTIRNALVAKAICGHTGRVCSGTLLHLSGVIMLGSALDHAQEPFRINREILNLPSMAAAAWYWHPERQKCTLAEYMEECERFCYAEYLPALALGDRLPQEKLRAVAEKVSEYSMLPVQKLMDDRLHIDTFRHPAQCMADEGKTISIYDSRFGAGRMSKPERFDFSMDDPCQAVAMPSFMGCYNGIWKDKLNIDTDEEYETLSYGMNDGWSFATTEYPPEVLEDAMRTTPGLKLMFGMGRYDMLTTVGWVHYLVSHYNYPKNRLWLNYYEAGHMPYLSNSAAAQLQDDIRDFIRSDKHE